MDNEQLVTQNIQPEPSKHPHIDITEEVAEGALDASVNIAGEALGEALENADDLPAIAIIGIVAGIIAAVGGIVFLICKIIKTCKKK